MLFGNIFPSFLSEYFIFRLLVACVLGAMIGIERDMHGRAAGLRTNLLVSLGAALFMIISENIAQSAGSEMRADPARVAAQIVTGIGFIGAGAIIKSGFTIRGLTTAACLWLSAGVGMSAGAGLFELAIVTTFIGIFALVFFNFFEKLYPKDSYRVLHVTTSNDDHISEIIQAIRDQKIKIMHLDKERDYVNHKLILKFSIKLFHTGLTDKASHNVVRTIESIDMKLYNIKWFHV